MDRDYRKPYLLTRSYYGRLSECHEPLYIRKHAAGRRETDWSTYCLLFALTFSPAGILPSSPGRKASPASLLATQQPKALLSILLSSLKHF
jgi:hypothetical protein